MDCRGWRQNHQSLNEIMRKKKLLHTFTFVVLWVEVNCKVVRHLRMEKKWKFKLKYCLSDDLIILMNYWLRAKVGEGQGEKKKEIPLRQIPHRCKTFFPLSFFKGIGHTGAFILCQVGLQALILSSLPLLKIFLTHARCFFSTLWIAAHCTLNMF